MFKSPNQINKKECSDTGLALILIFLLLFIFLKHQVYVNLALIVTVITMTLPKALKFIAWFWLSFSEALSSVMTKIILSALFYLLVTPVGRVVNIFRKDPLKLNCFKNSTASVFETKNHIFTKEDLENPF